MPTCLVVASIFYRGNWGGGGNHTCQSKNPANKMDPPQLVSSKLSVVKPWQRQKAAAAFSQPFSRCWLQAGCRSSVAPGGLCASPFPLQNCQAKMGWKILAASKSEAPPRDWIPRFLEDFFQLSLKPWWRKQVTIPPSSTGRNQCLWGTPTSSNSLSLTHAPPPFLS